LSTLDAPKTAKAWTPAESGAVQLRIIKTPNPNKPDRLDLLAKQRENAIEEKAGFIAIIAAVHKIRLSFTDRPSIPSLPNLAHSSISVFNASVLNLVA
jgi:hypothetical protein